MLHRHASLLSTVLLLASCQQTPSTADAPGQTTALPPAAALTQADARTAVGRYLQSQPNAALYVRDSARVNDNDTSWQVLVPRTDWAQRMPNRARFEVNKTTGAVHSAPVK